MSRSEPAITPPTQGPYRLARNPNPIVIVSAYSKTEASRRAGMSFIQRPKRVCVNRFAWPARGGWKFLPKRP